MLTCCTVLGAVRNGSGLGMGLTDIGSHAEQHLPELRGGTPPREAKEGCERAESRHACSDKKRVVAALHVSCNCYSSNCCRSPQWILYASASIAFELVASARFVTDCSANGESLSSFVAVSGKTGETVNSGKDGLVLASNPPIC